MLISKLTLIAALSLTAAAYPASRADDSTLDTAESLHPVGNSHPHSSPDDALQSGQRRPNRRPSTRHEGHDLTFPTPSQEPSSKPDRAGPSQGDQAGSPERPDGRPAGRPKGEMHGHDHLRDHDGPGMEGEQRPADRPSKPDDASHSKRPSDKETPTRMPSGSVESGAASEPTPSASLGPKMPTAPTY